MVYCSKKNNNNGLLIAEWNRKLTIKYENSVCDLLQSEYGNLLNSIGIVLHFKYILHSCYFIVMNY